MGYSSYTCSISNLPIGSGTPVRFFALVQDPFGSDWDGCWQPCTVPLKGAYNNSQSVGDIESGVVEREFFKTLARNVVEQKAGEKTRDVEVRKTMPREQWLAALREERLKIRHPVLLESEETHKRFLEGEAELRRELGHDPVVSTRPPEDPLDPKRFERHVRQAMIREDVWQYFLGIDSESFDAAVINLDYFREKFRKLQAPLPPGTDVLADYSHQQERRRILEDIEWDATNTDGVYVEALAELAQVLHVMFTLRCTWSPGSCCGPQDGRFAAHREFHSEMVRICRTDGSTE